MSTFTALLAGVYLGGAVVTLAIVRGDWLDKVVSAVLWFTFPVWRG